MNPSHAILARKISVALCATALAAGAIALSYRAGCAHNVAGNATFESPDYEFFSVWLMLPSLVMFAALFAVAANHSSMLRTAFRAACFLIVVSPLALAVLVYTEGRGQTERINPASASCKRFVSSAPPPADQVLSIRLKADRFAIVLFR
ncbi:MAG: hypothetical protein LBE81_06740 [Azonexus sp.]|jgi:hypothetical protein|uniref:hypothetical protein n=1 Tax=Azonexus sp. TaxID=1872668 RepID=UPI0028372EB5|nr:hypothetical protein [Azonexus sp.]MDR0776319.1 hypothetical protein [Azonexus sp.]